MPNTGEAVEILQNYFSFFQLRRGNPGTWRIIVNIHPPDGRVCPRLLRKKV